MNTSNFTLSRNGRKNAAERKKSLRAYMKEKRGEEVNRDVKEVLLVENFLAALKLAEMEGAESFLVYLAFSSEAPTDKLIGELLKRGKKVFCPRVGETGLEIAEYGGDLALSAYGIREPVGETSSVDPEIIVLPLLAADVKGNRLGYGKGYYDAFLKTSQGKRFAYCFDSQLISEVPTEEFDERMDFIVTERRIVEVG